MTNVRDDMFWGTTTSDKFTVVNDMVHRNGVPIPYIPHKKRLDSKGKLLRNKIDLKYFTFHYTAGRHDLDNLVTFMIDATTKADVHLCMNDKGHLVQLAPLTEKCWHMGDSSYEGHNGLNQYACGIEVTNPGNMDITGYGQYRTWYGQKFTALDGVREAKHQLHDGPNYGWLPYTDAQLTVMMSLSKAICDHYGAKLIGHDETTTRKLDPGPISQIDRMRDFIAGTGEFAPIPEPVEPEPTPVDPPVVTVPEEPKKKDIVESSGETATKPTWGSFWKLLFQLLFGSSSK